MLIYINSNKFPFVDMSDLTFLYKTAAWKVAPSQLDPASVNWREEGGLRPLSTRRGLREDREHTRVILEAGTLRQGQGAETKN